jgi:hypothetical protein
MQDPEHRDPSLDPGRYEERPGGARLTAGLRAVADDDGGVGASPVVEARLLAEVRSIARARRRRRHASVLALAAALLLAVAVPLWRASPRRPDTETTSPRVHDSRREVTTAFLPLLYSNIPFTEGQIVRLEVPRTALVSFGLASPDSIDGSSSRSVLADVLVGEDGLARAVRFVRPVPR